MKRLILLTVIIIIACSCKENYITPKKENNVKIEKEKAKVNNKKKELIDIYANTTKIIINKTDREIAYDIKTLSYAPFSKNQIFQISKKNDFNKFKSLLEKNRIEEYSCCPTYDFMIYFYTKNENSGEYGVDVTSNKNEVLIFPSNYQYCYSLKSKEWNEILNFSEKISYNEYFTTDLELARKVFKYTFTNELPIFTSNRSSNFWMKYNGHFYIKISSIGQNISFEEIKLNIIMSYPKDKFDIELTSQMFGNNLSKNAYYEMVIQIYSDKSFYDKFNLYHPKTPFENTIAEFCVIGERKELNKIDKIMKKEDLD